MADLVSAIDRSYGASAAVHTRRDVANRQIRRTEEMNDFSNLILGQRAPLLHEIPFPKNVFEFTNNSSEESR
jgi:hypothetical protein